MLFVSRQSYFEDGKPIRGIARFEKEHCGFNVIAPAQLSIDLREAGEKLAFTNVDDQRGTRKLLGTLEPIDE